MSLSSINTLVLTSTDFSFFCGSNKSGNKPFSSTSSPASRPGSSQPESGAAPNTDGVSTVSDLSSSFRSSDSSVRGSTSVGATCSGGASSERSITNACSGSITVVTGTSTGTVVCGGSLHADRRTTHRQPMAYALLQQSLLANNKFHPDQQSYDLECTFDPAVTRPDRKVCPQVTAN